MERTLWVFGDSFSVKSNTDETYLNFLAEKLPVSINYQSHGGTSLEYSYYRFNEVWDQIKEDDLVLITLTDIYRTWVNRDNPDYGMWGEIDRQTEKWLNLYKTEYYIEEEKYARLDIFFSAIDSRLKFLKSKPILLWCFRDEFKEGKVRVKPSSIQFSKGCLIDISSQEFCSEEDKPIINSIFLDNRPNHLSLVNHHILTSKLIEGFNNNSGEIDLTEGFKSKFIKKQL